MRRRIAGTPPPHASRFAVSGSNVAVVPTAVVTTEGEAEFAAPDIGNGSRLASATGDDQTAKVPLLSLDDFISAREIDRIDFIKMDIEGGGGKRGGMERTTGPHTASMLVRAKLSWWAVRSPDGCCGANDCGRRGFASGATRA